MIQHTKNKNIQALQFCGQTTRILRKSKVDNETNDTALYLIVQETMHDYTLHLRLKN